MHSCTNEEFKRFHEPNSKTTADKTQKIQAEGGLYCLDWKNLDFALFGSWRKTGDYSAINVRLIPCAVQFEAVDGSLVGGDDSCVWDQDEVNEYLGSAFNILVYQN